MGSVECDQGLPPIFQLRRRPHDRAEALRVLETVLAEGEHSARIDAALALWQLDRRRGVVAVLVRLLEDDPSCSRTAEAV